MEYEDGSIRCGSIRADDPDGFVAAFHRIAAILGREDVAASGEAAGALLVEEFVPGREVALEGLLMAGGGPTPARLSHHHPPPRAGPRRGRSTPSAG